MFHDHLTALRWIIESITLGALLAAIVGVLPSVAAGLAVVWYCVLLYDRIRRGPRR